MGRLYDLVKRIDTVILRKGLPVFKTKGLIAIKAGFPLALVDADSPDDPQKMAALRAAASEVLGEQI